MFRGKTKKLVISGLMLAIGVCLPLAFHLIGSVSGSVFLPMHIPVFLCGFMAGPWLGGLCGFILPYLNSFILGMPVMYPNAVIMSCELLTYGLTSGLIYRLFGCSKKPFAIYSSMLCSMIAGRIVYGAVAAILLFFNPAMKGMTVIAAIIQGVPGIIIQLMLVPQIVYVYRRIDNKY